MSLVLNNGKVLIPVWPEPSSWDPETEAIHVVDLHGERSVLSSGDRIVLGGHTGVPEYVSAPDPECAGDEIFVVTIVTVGDG
ncbi:MAG: hypothetical protein L0227_13655 [Chloroflexi bacterium]|nr:hypothetical protein [Chloroflexota bacterium]